MKNIPKTRDWMEMALDDMNDAIADFRGERYPSSVFHAQQCSEKLLKSVFYFLESFTKRHIFCPMFS